MCEEAELGEGRGAPQGGQGGVAQVAGHRGGLAAEDGGGQEAAAGEAGGAGHLARGGRVGGPGPDLHYPRCLGAQNIIRKVTRIY